MGYTVKKVAELANVSIRTLHHYDEIGLLQPAAVTPAGYRLYSDADLARLQQILFFRELGFSLHEIKAIVDSPTFDRKEALIAHKRILLEQQKRIEKLIQSVDWTIESIERNTAMSQNQMFEAFDESKLEEYREEARQRWGSERVDESYRRYNSLSKAQRDALQAESQQITLAIADRMDRDPGDPEVQEWIGRWHAHIGFFYECSLEVFRGLGDMYVDDSRFTAFYGKVRPGLAAFLRAAMHVYCDRQASQS